LILPNDERTRELAIPRPNGDVTPIEVSWLLFTRKDNFGGSYALQTNLMGALQLQEVEDLHRGIRESRYLSHNLRVVARIALDPRRYDTFDFAEAYDLDKGKVFPSKEERAFFENFHEVVGVVERPPK
jgi:hypothetical protein